MATTIEIKKVQLELMRVQSARMEMELKIDERQEEIKRIQDHIKVQEIKEVELMKALADLKAQP